MVIAFPILLLALIGFYMWWSRMAHAHPGPSNTEASSPWMPREVTRWLDAGLISKKEALAIASYEAKRSPERKIPLFSEAMGYIGAVLAMAGGGVALGETWDDLTDVQHVAVVGVATLLAFLGGWLIRSKTEPALQRLMSVLWALSVGGVAATLRLFFADVVDLSEDALLLTIGGLSGICAAFLWRSHPYALQQAGVFATGLAATIGLIVAMPGEASDWVFAIAVWAYGFGWLVLAWREMVTPAWSAMGLGSVVGSWGPTFSVESAGWLLVLGLCSGAALMVAGVKGRRFPLLVVGSIASFVYLTATVVRYFGDPVGVSVALAAVGVIVLGVAIALGRKGAFRGGSTHRVGTARKR